MCSGGKRRLQRTCKKNGKISGSCAHEDSNDSSYVDTRTEECPVLDCDENSTTDAKSTTLDEKKSTPDLGKNIGNDLPVVFCYCITVPITY